MFSSSDKKPARLGPTDTASPYLQPKYHCTNRRIRHWDRLRIIAATSNYQFAMLLFHIHYT
jgi:hypothetical protein